MAGYHDVIPIPPTTKPAKYCVLADLLIPGKGDPIKAGCLVVEGSKITFAGKASDLQLQGENLPKTHVKVISKASSQYRGI